MRETVWHNNSVRRFIVTPQPNRYSEGFNGAHFQAVETTQWEKWGVSVSFQEHLKTLTRVKQAHGNIKFQDKLVYRNRHCTIIDTFQDNSGKCYIGMLKWDDSRQDYIWVIANKIEVINA